MGFGIIKINKNLSTNFINFGNNTVTRCGRQINKLIKKYINSDNNDIF